MQKSIIIIGMGPRLSLGVAKKFGQEGYAVGMISRTESNLIHFQNELQSVGITSCYATADVADDKQLVKALEELSAELGQVDVLHYNAVDMRIKDILEEEIDDLVNGFRISVANALVAVRFLLPILEKTRGAILLTGGGAADYPNPAMGSISLGKAGVKNLTYQLDAALKERKVYVGTVTVSGWINHESDTHSPDILAEKFWELHKNRTQIELVY